MNPRKRPPRLRLPDQLTGAFTGMLIGPFGADLAFAERQLFRQLPKSVVNRVILADARQLASHLERATDLRRVNRTYVAAPVRSPHAHHPKYILLVGPDEGLLLVGSGNLSIPGYTGPGECFCTYRWSAETPDQVDAFAAIRDLADGLMGNEWVDPVARSRVHDLFSTATWLPETPGPASPVIHNLRVPLIDRLVAQVNGRQVNELVVAAPFHDRGARALGDLVERLSPTKVILLVQERQTRLDRPAIKRLVKRRNLDFDVELIEAPSPYPATWLHAKFCLVRMTGADVLLQGSANISSVALCQAGESANVEVVNLLEGRADSFDDLLRALDRSPLVEGLHGFEPAAWDKDDSDEADPQPLIDTLTWTPPRLEGQVYGRVEADALTVHVGDRRLVPLTIGIEHTTGDRTLFTCEFGDDDASRIDLATSIRIEVDGLGTATLCPYHLHSLLRLTSAGHRVDLLQEAGVLDLNDAELEDLLAELDRVLIVDGRSLWRLAHPDREDDQPDGPDVRVSYDDLDWERIGEQPAYRQYQTTSAGHSLAPTELGIVLKALTDRFRADVRRGLGTEPDDDADDDADDLDIEQEPEDADEADEASSDDDDGQPHHLTAKTRIRKLWRNFVRRFVDGLDDDDFVMSVGSNVIIPSYIVFNHLCRRLRVVDLIDPDFLTEAQVRLWSFIWGDADSPGYLRGLPEDERSIARQLLAEHEDLPALLAAVDDAFWHVWNSDGKVFPLRGAWRSFLGNDAWNPDPEAVGQAAAVAMYFDGDKEALLRDLTDLAEWTESFELSGAVAASLGLSKASVIEKSDYVMRTDSREVQHFYAVEDPKFELTLELASGALATWRAIDPDVRYLRLTAKNATAVLDLDHGVHAYYGSDGEERALDIAPRPLTRWLEGLNRLVNAA